LKIIRAADLTTPIEITGLLRRTFLALVLLMTFRTFQYFPGMLMVQEAWFMLCFLMAVTIYPFWKLARGLKFCSFELYVLMIMMVALLLPAWGAKREFGQPLLYGVLAQRGIVLVVIPLMLVHALRHRFLRPADLEKALLIAAWGTFFLYTAMRLALNPDSFVSNQRGFIVGVDGKHVFNLPGWFIVFGIFYYALLGLRTRRGKYYAAAAILFTAAFSDISGRALMVSIVLTLLFFLYRWRPHLQFISTLAKASCLTGVVLGVIYLINPAVLSSRFSRFGDAFSVAFTGTPGEDPSATERAIETVVAFPFILDHPLLGNGAVSNQWEGGNEGALGTYFYPGDIGIIGILFAVGAVGFFVFAYQFRFAVRAVHLLPEQVRGPLSDAAAAVVLCNAVNSVSNGVFFFDPQITLLYIAILVGLSTQDNRASSDAMAHMLASSGSPVSSPSVREAIG
jgi:hypothetical protein